jgi:DNA-directed RNA polymerase beta subunit
MTNFQKNYKKVSFNEDNDQGFRLIKEYFSETKFVKHQIDQYNHFITNEIKNIVLREPPIRTTCKTLEIKFLNIEIDKPYFVKKVMKKNKTIEPKLSGSCIEIASDAGSLETGEIGSYETVSLFPNEARKRNINYDGYIYLDVEIKNLTNGKITINKKIPIGKLPVMLHSKICWLNSETSEISEQASKEECFNESGGYFVIKGKERVLVSQMRRAYNRVYVEKEDSVYVAEIRSINRNGTSILVHLRYNPFTFELLFSLPYIKTKQLLPAGIVFKALGIEEEQMLFLCRVPENVKNVLKIQYNLVDTQENAIKLIAKDMIAFKEKEMKKSLYIKDKTDSTFLNETVLSLQNNFDLSENTYSKIKTKIETEESSILYVKDVLQNELFYHIGELTFEKSAKHLGFMIKKIVSTALKIRVLDDKDNIANKRLDATSSLLSFLFQIVFKQFSKTVLNQIDGKKSPDPVSVMKDLKNITNAFNQAFMTGSWNTQKSPSSSFTRIGVSQVLNRQNYGAKMSHLRRLMLPIGGKGKNPSIRQLHPSHFSFICPYETPEGETVGIVSNLSLSAYISVDVDPYNVNLEINKFSEFKTTLDGKCLILINGNLIGSCNNPRIFKQQFNLLRLQNVNYRDLGMIHLFYEKEIHIETDEGRFVRPLFAINQRNKIEYKELSSLKNISDISWKECVNNGSIVFRDVWELEQSVVAMIEDDLEKNKCDYLEISPSSTMMAIMASVIPLSNHSQSPRNAYQASMGKQAIGIPTLAYHERYDTTLHVLNYSQKPITKNNMVNVLKFNEMNHGAVPIVAIMTFSGFNQEDSIILNKSSIDRGLFSSTTYKTIVEEEKKKGKTDVESICLPKYQYRNRNYDYSYLNKDGIVWQSNVWLKKGTVIVGKITNKIKKNEITNKIISASEVFDSSLIIKNGEEGFLDKVLITINGEGARVIKIRIRIPRRPEIGDKFASSTAQKGTCGMIFQQEDLPFDENGIHPDLIINPHAIPSRMTINMLIEMFFNRIGCELGIEMDATPFKHRNIEEELEFWANKSGISLKASVLMDGRTGAKMKARIFMAPCLYQRLKHLVSDKIHARMSGPLDTLTHQPVAGRAKNGALRFGEMEKDALLAHGSTRVLKENLFDKSDAFQIPVCINCGKIPDKRIICEKCGSLEIENKNMPYATKLLLQELAGMGVKSLIS